MEKKLTVLVMLLVLAGSFHITTSTVTSGRGNILLVDDDAVDDPENYTWNTISKALDHATRGDIIKVYNGTYFENLNIDKDITILGQDTDLFGDDINGVIVDGGGVDNVMVISSYGVYIKGLTVQHSGGDGAGFHIRSHSTTIEDCTISYNTNGILCTETRYILLSGNTIVYNTNTGVSLKSCSEDIKIAENNISSNKKGIVCERSTNVFIKDNHLFGNNEAAIELLDSSKYNQIDGNHGENNLIGVKLWWHSNNNNIIGNTFLNNTETGVYVDFGTSVQTSDLSIAHNTLQNNAHYGIYLFHVRGAECMNNKVIGSTTGIYCEWSNYSTIQGNNITDNQVGIYHVSSVGNTVSNNDILDNGEGCFLSFSQNTKLINNLFEHNIEGISIDNSEQNTVQDNIIRSNTEGMILNAQANNNNIIQNHIVNNSHNGINAGFSRENHIRDNTIYDNKNIGIYLYFNSNDNQIYHNNFLNNTLHAFDSCENIWSNCETTGGNYWDDYTGVDADGNGFGDTPYNISGGDNKDFCPFMEENGWEYLSDLFCTGTLTWTNIKAGDTVQGSFSIQNIGKAGSTLDWEITDHPEWGTWTFSPESGQDLKPEQGQVQIQVTVKVPNEKNQDFTGEITVINTNNANDIDQIHVTLSTALSKNPRFVILQRILMDRFSYLIQYLPSSHFNT